MKDVTSIKWKIDPNFYINYRKNNASNNVSIMQTNIYSLFFTEVSDELKLNLQNLSENFEFCYLIKEKN